MTKKTDQPQPEPKEAGRTEVPASGETVCYPITPENAALEPKVLSAWVGKSLGKYQITGILGQGGMGVVLKAHDPAIERDVAIKILATGLLVDNSTLERFRSEARSAGKLSHPNVTSIYEIGQEGQTHYLVMEFVAGGSVADALEKAGAFSVLEATRIVMDACKGMAAAHTVGLIHRDIKPANLLRSSDRTVKITDFGLAKPTSETDRQITQTGMVVGTPYFMSPEQCQALPVDSRSDLYSLGATYYCLLTGKQPYQDSENVMQVMYAHCHQDIPDPRRIDPSIPMACSAIIARAMAKVPADRYESANEMLADLTAVAGALSGEAQILLPSQSGMVPATQRPAQPTPPTEPTQGHSSSRWVAYGFGLLVVLAVATLAIWQPWDRSPSVGGLPQGEPVLVGVLHSMSGTMAASESVVVDATLLAIDDLNQSGGVLGRPVKAVVADGRSDPETFSQEADRLILKDHVCTIFGCWTSASRKTVLPVFEERDHLLIYPLQYEGLETSPNIIYMGAAPNQQIVPAIQWAREVQHKKRFFLVGSDYVFPRAAHEIIKDQLKKLDGEVVGEAFMPLGSQQVEATVEALRAAKPDMILNTINGDTNIAFFRALRQAGIASATVPCLSFSIDEQGLRSLNLADVEGDYAAWTYFQSVATAENEAFVKRFQDKYPQRVISDPMATAYVGVKLWAQAVEEAQSLEPRKIRRAMLTQRLVGPEGNVRLDPDTQHCYKTPLVGQIQSNGQFRIVWRAREPLRPDPYPATRTAAVWRAFLHDLYTGWGNRWAAPDEK